MKCDECGKYDYRYEVKAHNAHICVSCLEATIGRRITRDDLTSNPINFTILRERFKS